MSGADEGCGVRVWISGECVITDVKIDREVCIDIGESGIVRGTGIDLKY